MTERGHHPHLPEYERKNDVRRRTTRSETNSQNERRLDIDPNKGPKHERP